MNAIQTGRRRLFQAAVAVGAAIALQTAIAQPANWPEAPVRIVVPFTAGGAADVLTRILAQQLQVKFGQNFLVENRTGAGGNIGMEAVKNAAPDGYTIASATIGTLSINQFLFAKMGYDPVNDFTYVSKIWENCNVFVVPAIHPAKSVKEFLDWAKTRPKGVVYSSAGVGTTPHLAGELFSVRNGLQTVHVPYRGAAQATPALVAGDTDFAIDNIANESAMIKAGKVKPLAVTCPQRWPTLPDVPTMAESGVKDFVVTSWGAFVMPKGTPAAIANKVSAAIQEFAKDPAIKERFLQTGALTVATTPKETEAFAESERMKWKEVVRISGAKME